MGYDDVLMRMGEFGRYQRRTYLLVCLPVILCAIHKLAGVFLGAKMNTRCLLPWENENATFYLDEDIMNTSYPWDRVHGFSQCYRRANLTMFYTDYGDHEDKKNIVESNNLTKLLNNQEHIPCQDFVFDTSIYKRTTASEWYLVCDRVWLRAVGDSLFMIGVTIGSMTFGALSDKFGRKPTFVLSLVTQLGGGILVAVSPGYIVYIIFRMIVGASASGVFLVAYVTAVEVVGPKKRLIAGVGCQLFFTTGYLLLAGFAYFIPDWRTLQIAITLPSVVFLIYWWFIPESARWLLSNGKDEEAKEILQRAARENGVEISSDILNDLLKENNSSTPDIKKASVLDLFRNSYLRRKCLLLFFNWFVTSSTYYGLSLNASNLGGNDHLNFLISGIVEIPAYVFLICTLNRWGRKIILCGSMLLSGTALIITIFFPLGISSSLSSLARFLSFASQHLAPPVRCIAELIILLFIPARQGHWGVVMFAMLGKLAITASYGTIYIFTAEQFPTVVRNVGMGACSTFAKIGGAIAPFINYLSEIWEPFPLIIFGVCALIGGLLSLLLPETANKQLPDSIRDVEVLRLQDEDLKARKRKERREIAQLDVHQLNDFEIGK